MTDRDTGSSTGRFAVRATSDSHFSWIRTRLSLERTLMSWARTAVALIGFGFTIVKFFESVQEMPDAEPARFINAPMYIGLAMILAGVMALLISIFEYRWALKYLWSDEFKTVAGAQSGGKRTPLLAVSVFLVIVGLFAFVAVLFRL